MNGRINPDCGFAYLNDDCLQLSGPTGQKANIDISSIARRDLAEVQAVTVLGEVPNKAPSNEPSSGWFVIPWCELCAVDDFGVRCKRCEYMTGKPDGI